MLLKNFQALYTHYGHFLHLWSNEFFSYGLLKNVIEFNVKLLVVPSVIRSGKLWNLCYI